MRNLTLLFATISLMCCYFQLKSQESWGGRVGLNFQIGSHLQRIGVMYQVYYFKDHLTLTHSNYIRFNLKALGPENSYFETKLQFGFQGQWTPSSKEKHLLNEYSNVSPFLNSIGYNFYLYLDGKNMSQTTGAIYGTASDILWSIENDALGLNQVDDKYRTGGFYLAYEVDSMLFGVQSTLWTANSSEAPKVNDKNYPGRFGYRDISDIKYGDKSHGIFAFNAQYKLDFDQVAFAELGIDSETIRHAIQNKLIHDGLSKRIVKSESAHYPMLQDDGSMYLFKEGQKRKNAKIYLQVGANDGVFY